MRDVTIKSIYTLCEQVENMINQSTSNENQNESIITHRDTILEKVERVKTLNYEILNLLSDDQDDEFEKEEVESTKFTLFYKLKLAPY